MHRCIVGAEEQSCRVAEMVLRCRGADEVQRCRVSEVQAAELQLQWFRAGSEVQVQRTYGSDSEVQRYISAKVQRCRSSIAELHVQMSRGAEGRGQMCRTACAEVQSQSRFKFRGLEV